MKITISYIPLEKPNLICTPYQKTAQTLNFGCLKMNAQ